MRYDTTQVTVFADPYKRCRICGEWIDGMLKADTLTLVPCRHRGDHEDVCPSYDLVTGCMCDDYNSRHPEKPIHHDMRQPDIDDDRTY